MKKYNSTLQNWKIKHITGIPYNSSGQALVERAHHTLKIYLLKQKRGSMGLSPREQIAKALFTLNFLNIGDDGYGL